MKLKKLLENNPHEYHLFHVFIYADCLKQCHGTLKNLIKISSKKRKFWSLAKISAKKDKFWSLG